MSDGNALKTDYYELTMTAAILANGREKELATFDLSFRNLPPKRNYLLAAGLEPALEFLKSLKFSEGDISYLREKTPLKAQPPAFFEFLAGLTFTGDVWAVPEGTPVFAREPVLTVRAPLPQALIAETMLVNIIGTHTLFASKASRIVESVRPSLLIEMGARRAHGADAADACVRSSYLAGFDGSSYVDSCKRYGIPPMGTMSHAYVSSHASELEAFRAYAKAHGDRAVFLVDTYDVASGIKNAVTVAKEMEQKGQKLSGIRIDSGDLAHSSKIARKALDDAGLRNVKITLTSDLDEERFAEMRPKGAVFDFIGIGSRLATSSDAPILDGVYKICEREEGGKLVPAMKFSEGKETLPGLKQVFRQLSAGVAVKDVIALEGEPVAGTALLRKMMESGVPVPLPALEAIREYAFRQVTLLPPSLRRPDKQELYPVELSDGLQKMVAAFKGVTHG